MRNARSGSSSSVSSGRSDISSTSVRHRLTKEQVQLEEARASSSASVASSYSRANRSLKVSPPGAASSKTSNSKSTSAPMTPTTYADEYLRAALASPSPRPYKRCCDSSAPFPSHATLTPSHASYTSDVGRVYDDPPEITSIPTDEIVDSYTRPTIGEPNEEKTKAEPSDAEGPDDENEKVTPRESTDRGSRDQYTFGRLQARASKRRELLQQVPEEEDVTNYHSTTRASRIKHIRSLYLPVSDEKESKKSTAANSISSPIKQTAVRGPVMSPANKSEHGAKSPTNPAPHSPANQSVQSRLSTIGNTGVSPKNDNAGTTVGSPTNRSTVPTSPTNQSVTYASELSTIANSAEASAVTSPNWVNASTAQSFGRKSSLASTNSDELSEYRAKLFAKMLHLLDDVENPGLHSSSTKASSHRSHEYSVAELKLIQKRTEEEMSRILKEFDRSRVNTSRVGGAVEAKMEESTDYHDYSPPGNVMTEAISSKLSDITSPTCQDGSSSVYIDVNSDKYMVVTENEDETADLSPRNFPPRPASPRKKRTPVFPPLCGEDSLPVVEESNANVFEKVFDATTNQDSSQFDPSDENNMAESPSSDTPAHEVSTLNTVSPQTQTRDNLITASRIAAQRTVQKQKQDEEDRFYCEVMNSVSAAEAEDVQRLNDEMNAFVATFDKEVDEEGLMNEDGSINEQVMSAMLAEGNCPADESHPHHLLHVPKHEPCGAGCVIQ